MSTVSLLERSLSLAFVDTLSFRRWFGSFLGANA